MTFPLQVALVFFALVAVDICWAMYIAKVAEGKAIASSTWSALIMLCGAFVTLSYIEDKRLLAPAILGAWVGTYISVRFLKKKETA